MIVIITGMHRSGTSALAGLLHSNGIVMGEDNDFYPPPMKENPKGFYENKKFRIINDKLLNIEDYRVKSFNPDVPKIEKAYISPVFLSQMRACINYYDNKYKVWGWKDPRSCLTLDIWLPLLSEMNKLDKTKVLVSYRSYEDIALSMIRRGNRERRGKNQFRQLALVYYTRMIDSIMKYGASFKKIDFDNLIRNTKDLASDLSVYLGMEISKTDFVDFNISKTRIYK